ncbi:cell cycle progression protein 1 isoform X3 [Denticeps clupeoides]|uniref:cell cycle progression protein 1 isoform X3 n=1 Tax=Denticeps clupeoides TaxID=299321 RepID=UPI0010A58A15|nr:cell cycle progression protein 1 isoform X3 [Denticeps clupeoides]
MALLQLVNGAMSESSSDTESSCGWTIISNEGSDIETIGPENVPESEPEVSESGPVQLDESHSACDEQKEELDESSLDTTLKAESFEKAQSVPEAGAEVVPEEHVTLCSSSDHSDIVTLGDSSREERVVGEEDEDANGSEDLYMGTSCSSHYTFSAAENSLMMSQWSFSQSLRDFGSHLKEQLSGSRSFSAAFPREQPAPRESSSSDEELKTDASPAVRRRRLRRSTVGSEPEEERQPVEMEAEEVQEAPEPRASQTHQGQVNGTLNKCILLALVIAISMGFGHFYGKYEGTVQIRERQRAMAQRSFLDIDIDDPSIQTCEPDVEEVSESLREDLEKHYMMFSLTGPVDKLTKENQQLRLRQAELQAQKEVLSEQLKQTVAERGMMESDQERLAKENQQLKNLLDHEEASLSALRDELWSLRAQIRQLEERGTGADSILSENQRLKDHLEEERQRVRSILGQREALVAEAQALRGELDRERQVTDKLKEELMSRGADPETEELQYRLAELEKKLSFEQQRSDLWERLYVESKEEGEKAKGERQSKVKKPKDGMFGKVKETFDAVKNSTKEFVHHHKEQIKKAKEAVKENLRKFSDSVKSTFRHFKDSASGIFDRNRRPHERKYHEKMETKHRNQDRVQDKFTGHGDDAPWHHKPQKPLHRHPRKSTMDSSSYADRNTRKPGGKKGAGTAGQKGSLKGCTGVFDCAYQESMSLFNKAMDPIRADEFNQLLHSYLQQEVDHFHHWNELEGFINNFFHNGVFIHDQMLFTDFVSGVEDYLEDMDEYHGHSDDVFEDLDDYIYKHFFGDTYSKRQPFEDPNSKTKESRQARQQRKQERVRPRPHKERKWNRPGRPDRHMAEVKIELGPMPFDPKY